MRTLRSTAFIVSVLLAASTAWAARPTAAKPAATNRATARLKSPYKAGLPRLPSTSILTLLGTKHLDARQYRDIRAASLKLLELYPPETHYFVGLGRDPAPILAFLQNLGGKDLAVNFPASSNEANRAGPKVLSRYVERIIPAEILTSGRAIVFVDATSSGRALDHYVPRIAKSLPGIKVIKAAFGVGYGTGPNRKAYGIYANPGDKQVIDTGPFPEVDKFFGAPYEGVVSEFPRHGPGTHSIKVLKQPRPEYQEFRDALMERMQRDKTLDTFLTRRAR